MTRHDPVQFCSTVATVFPSKWLNLTNMTSNKADAIPEELKSCALKRIEKRYPEQISCSISTLTAHTCQKQTKLARDGSIGCLRAQWPWERTPPTTMVRSWLFVKLQRIYYLLV
ncbi:hypothetical protein TNCV_3444081 [Trichonephila clavipes]|nr:hypothetical protein TNCV_3444081 [Trichonephila clavipes]